MIYLVSWLLSLYTLKRNFKRKVYGSENAPRKGAFIFASNHESYLDPLILGTAIPWYKWMYYLAKKDLFDRPLKAWYLKMIHAMPLDREGDITAIKSVVKMLKSGKSLILFPEGTRSKGDKLLPAKPGAGFVVAKSGAPVLPAYIDGSYECMPADKGSANKGRSFSVYIGKPIRFDSVDANDKNAYQKISDEIMRNIAELKEKNDSSADRPSAGKHV